MISWTYNINRHTMEKYLILKHLMSNNCEVERVNYVPEEGKYYSLRNCHWTLWSHCCSACYIQAFCTVSTFISLKVSSIKKKKQPADFVCLFTGLQTVGIFRVGSSKKRVRQVSENEDFVILSVSLDISLNY